MSENFQAKIARIERLDEREAEILAFLMQRPDIRVIEIARQMNLGESTTRNILTSVYVKLGIPEGERDKRGYLVREYREAYRGYQDDEGEEEVRSRDPRINVTPPNPGVSRTTVIVSILGGFLLMTVVVVAVLIFFLNRLNQPAQAVTPSLAPPVSQNQEAVPNPTQEQPAPLEPTNIPPTDLPTPIPPTETPRATPTPKEYYNQNEGAVLREGVYLTLDPEFFKTSWAGCEYLPGFKVQFAITNKRSEEFLARYDRFGFSAVDDTGKSYELMATGWGQCENLPGGVTTAVRASSQKWFILAFEGEIPLEARYIEITVNDISGSGKIVFRKGL